VGAVIIRCAAAGRGGNLRHPLRIKGGP